MVVLEGANTTIPMLTIGNNQYLQPDYMSPGNSATLDSKKSPLALLAQTCSQIGADSNNVKSLVSSPSSGLDKSKKLDNTQQQQQQQQQKHQQQQQIQPSVQKMDKINDLSFKPYETNVLSRKNLNGDDIHRPLSKASSVDDNLSDESNKSNAKKDIIYNNSRVSSRNSNRESPASVNSNNNNNNNSIDNKNHNIIENDSEKSELNKSPSLSQKESPRSALDLLQSQQKDMGMYKAGFNPFYPAGIDPTNPAFRSSFTSALSQHHASMLAAAAASGYPQNAANPYLSYARIKTPTGGEALVPVCKDPYCTGCQYSAHNQQMLMGVPCPAGCAQCEQQKYGLAMAMSSLPPNHPFAQMSKPFACNWLLHDGYCGRRYSTTDELIQHMKTHSPNLSDPATAASILAAQQSAASLMPPLFFPPGLHRSAASAYPPSTSPLSPLSASRYHPYAKPGTLPSAASPYSSFNPALSAYYPPYSWMTPSQRLGAAAAAAAHP
ncbi:zinc finger protein Noc-like [Chironomus tepperi]|uniref:zinc finger protein Noc-like n=1 Tax=Chironomus tepperi TaxID=113505 RepID=UPI00391F8F2C